MNERAFGSRVRRFCAILAILCIPYQDIRRFQSFIWPSSRTRLTTYGALASRSIESLSTSQKRYSENECMNSLSLIDTKIVTFSDTRLKLVFEIDPFNQWISDLLWLFDICISQLLSVSDLFARAKSPSTVGGPGVLYNEVLRGRCGEKSAPSTPTCPADHSSRGQRGRWFWSKPAGKHFAGCVYVLRRMLTFRGTMGYRVPMHEGGQGSGGMGSCRGAAAGLP